MIKRYSISYDSKEENYAGDWCAASDVAALEARCATLTAEVMHYTSGTQHPLEARCRELTQANVDVANINIDLIKRNRELESALKETSVDRPCRHYDNPALCKICNQPDAFDGGVTSEYPSEHNKGPPSASETGTEP